MLKLNNIKITKHIKYFVISIVILSFAFAGIYQTIATNQPYVAKIDGKKITVQEYNEYLSKRRTEILSNSMTEKDIYIQALSFVESEQFSKLALNEMVNRIVIHKFLTENNIYVNTEIVANYIKTLPVFQKNNKFDSEYLKQYLKYANISQYEFLQNQIPQVEQTLFQNLVSPTNIQSQTLAKKYAIALKKEKNIEILQIHSTNQPTFSQNDLKKVYEKNKNNFIEKPQHFVTISYIDDYINKNLNIFNSNSEAIINYYNEGFMGKVVDFYYTEFRDEKTAQTVQSIVQKQGISLRTLTDEIKKEKPASIIKNEELSSEKTEDTILLKAISKLSEGNVTNVIKKDKSYIVLQITKIHEEKFTHIANSQQNQVAQQRRCHNANIYIEKIKEELSSGPSFESVSLKYGFPISKEIKFDSSTGNVYDANTNIPVQINQTLKEHIMQNKDTQYGNVVIMDKTTCSYAIYQQNRIEPQRFKTLDEVRGEVIAIFTQEQQLAELENSAKTIIGQMKSLKTQLNSYSNQGIFFNATVSLENTPSQEIFNHKIGEVFYILDNKTNSTPSVLIIKINSEKPFFGEISQEELENAKQFTSQSYNTAFVKTFMENLYKKYKVTTRFKQD